MAEEGPTALLRAPESTCGSSLGSTVPSRASSPEMAGEMVQGFKALPRTLESTGSLMPALRASPSATETTGQPMPALKAPPSCLESTDLFMPALIIPLRATSPEVASEVTTTTGSDITVTASQTASVPDQ